MAIDTLSEPQKDHDVRSLVNQRSVLMRLLRYLRPHIKPLIYAFSILLCATAADVAGPVLIRIFIDDFLAPRIFDITALIMLGGGYLGLVLLSAVLHYRQLVAFNQIALKIIQTLRVEVFSKVQFLGLRFFDFTPGGALVSRITNDTEAIKELYLGVLSTYVQNIVFLCGIFIAMFVLDVRLATLCLIFLPLILLLMQIYRIFSSRVYRVLRKQLSQLNAKLNETLQGMNIVQAMNQEKRFRHEFSKINESYYQSALLNIKLDSVLMRPAVDVLYTLAFIIVLSYFGLQSLTGPVEIGIIYAFINYLDRFFEPVNMMMMRLSQLQQAIVAAERVFGLMDDVHLAPGQKPDIAQYEKSPKTSECRPKIEEGKIEFHNVSFSYDGVTEVLKNITFTVEPGQTVALVGHTGSGKSTISNLLMRFYPLNQGEIRIDGIPLMDYSEEEIRLKIGLVAQDPFLFAGDVAQNIRLERPEITPEDVRAAAHFVQADEFIGRLPLGYDEPVGERGATFSSGQRQLLCFARTMAGNPKILILDEATANVDTETELGIQTALNKMRLGRTTVAIAHRLSTIQDADLILVLHRGQIVERGNHNELLGLKGLYYKMFLLQQ
ncbi:multidrug ABC transporter ATP-binding protein [Desulfitobacterium metallireducens DSM 15288]|uniref:Multidrug ABC transporter ATP-binding protein n=2 Tax=Desulfitobacterium TaxID=36853 RepID=W0E7V6_9FIRM|nr:multidrug ABC transporter ATP-binding protein [Desulfitobacterium metallireducens DSM 15288]